MSHEVIIFNVLGGTTVVVQGIVEFILHCSYSFLVLFTE